MKFDATSCRTLLEQAFVGVKTAASMNEVKCHGIEVLTDAECIEWVNAIVVGKLTLSYAWNGDDSISPCLRE